MLDRTTSNGDPRNKVIQTPVNEIWTEERIGYLQRCWEEGYSCSQIASLMPPFTRNAIIGKVRRLGLEFRAERDRHVLLSRKAARLAAKERNKAGKSYEDRRLTQAIKRPVLVFKEKQPATVAEFDAAIPPEQRKTIFELNEDTCHWGVGDPGTPGFFFCGGETATVIKQVRGELTDAKSSYCCFHHRVAHQPAPKRADNSPPPTRYHATGQLRVFG